MKYEEYKGIVEETAVFPQKVENFGVAYCWLGLLGELGELGIAFSNAIVLKEQTRNIEYNKDVIKEAGDVQWYVTAMAKELNIPLEKYLVMQENLKWPSNNPEDMIWLLIANFTPTISEMIKKFYRDGKPLDKNTIGRFLARVMAYLKVILETVGTSYETCLEMNYNKLIKRRETNTLHGDGDNREET